MKDCRHLDNVRCKICGHYEYVHGWISHLARRGCKTWGCTCRGD